MTTPKLFNFDLVCEDKEDVEIMKKLNTNPYLPIHYFRMGICSPSAGGKTNLILNLLLGPDENMKLNYSRVWLLCPMEPKYEYLKTHLEGVRVNIANKLIKNKKIDSIDEVPSMFQHFNSSNDIPPLNQELKDERNPTILIVDDQVLDKNTNKRIEEMIIKSRKYHLSIIYVSQFFYKIPMTIRSQINYWFIFGFKDSRKMNEFAKTFATDIEPKRFKQLYKEAMKTPYSPLMVDLQTNNPHLKYRAGLFNFLKDV